MNYPVALTIAGAIVVGTLTSAPARADQQTIKRLGQVAVYNVSLHYNALNMIAFDTSVDDFNREQALEALQSYDFKAAVATMMDSLKSTAKAEKAARGVARAARKAARDALAAQEAPATQAAVAAQPAAAKTAAAVTNPATVKAAAAPAPVAVQQAAAAKTSKATVNTATAIEQAQVAQDLVAQAEISAQTLKSSQSTPAQIETAIKDVNEAWSKVNNAFRTSAKASAKARTPEAKAARQKAMEAKKAMSNLASIASAKANAIAEAKLSPIDRLTKSIGAKIKAAITPSVRQTIQRQIKSQNASFGVRG